MLRKVFPGRRRLLATTVAAALAAPAVVRAQQVLRSSKASYSLRMLTLDLEQPWGMAFLPDGRLLITERPGRLRIFANGRLERAPVGGLPKVYARGQGGLLDICLHPDFARNAQLYLTYSGEGEGGAATVLARAEFRNNALVGVRRIFEALPRTSGGLHFGSRGVFDRAGLLYVTCGERYQMQRAQNLADLGGKVVRLRADGSVGLTLTSARPDKSGVVGRAKEIATKEEADALRGLKLFVPRDRLPEPEEDEFYLADLIGLEARDPEDAVLGRVKSVQNFGAGDMLEIAPAAGGPTWYLPFTREAAPELHIADGWLRVVRPAEVGEREPD